MEKSIQEEVAVHRQILQGMALHLQQLSGEMYQMKDAIEQLISVLSREEPSEAGSSAVPETSSSE